MALVVLCLTSARGESLPPEWRDAPRDFRAATALREAIESERAAGGYGDITPVAESLLSVAESETDPEAAAALARLAATAAPGDPRPHAYLFRLGVTRLFDFGMALRHLGAVVYSLARDPWVQSVWMLRVAVVLCAAAWAAALGLVVVGTVSFGAPLLHDYSDSFPRRFRKYTPVAFGVFTYCVLLAVGVGPAVTFLLIALLHSPYLPPRGRVTLGVCLALGCAMPLSLDWLSGVAREPGTRAWALYRVWRGDSGKDLATDLARVMPPGDARGLIARALVARRQGEYEQSAAFLGEALKTHPDRASIHLELGNLFFLRGRPAEALSEYARVAADRPKDPIPWLNRHVTFLAQLELAEADLALQNAKAIDAEATERYQHRILDESGTLLPISAPLPAAWIRSELLGHRPSPVAWNREIRAGLFTPAHALRPVYFGLFALLVTFVGGRPAVGRRSHRCPSCGFVVCPRCSRRVKGTYLCPACWAITREKQADAIEKDRQTEYIRKWSAVAGRWARAGRLLLPGWTDFLFGGSVRRGMFHAVIWALGMGMLAQGLLYPAPLLPWGRAGVPLIGLVLLLATYLAGVRQALGARPAGGR